jgi:hypothetical protein
MHEYASKYVKKHFFSALCAELYYLSSCNDILCIEMHKMLTLEEFSVDLDFACFVNK